VEYRSMPWMSSAVAPRRDWRSPSIVSSRPLDHAVVDGAGVEAGVYVARFAVRAFYTGMSIACPFLDLVEFRFEISDPGEHVHLPLKFSPWGLALFRGV
jgi:5-hydroxyisourate hydrolase